MVAAHSKSKRSAWRGGPPADGSITSRGDVRFTADDVADFSGHAGLAFSGGGSAIADILNRSVAWYVLAARMQATQSERASASEWGVALAEWASSGRLLLGDKSQTPHCGRALIHLSSASQRSGSREEAVLTNNILMATGACPPNIPQYGDGEYSRVPAEIIASLLERLAYTLRALELMGPTIKHVGAEKKKQVDHARLHLIRELRSAFKQAHPRVPFTVSTRRRTVETSNEREAMPDGPAVRWCRAILTTAPERMILHGVELMPELAALSDWAARTDALPIVIRKLNVKASSKSAKEER